MKGTITSRELTSGANGTAREERALSTNGLISLLGLIITALTGRGSIDLA